MLVEDSLCCFV